MTDNLFEGVDNTPAISIDPEKNYLEELVGEGKKFQSPEELARGKAEADATIDFFKNQMDRLRADYLKERETNTSRAGLEEILNEIKQLKSTSNTNDDESGANGTDKKEPAFDPNKLQEIVAQQLTEAEQKRHRSENRRIVVEKLTERFGSDYQRALRDQTRRLGLTEEVATQLAETSPEAFLRTLGIDKQEEGENFAPPRNQDNRGTFNNKKSGKIIPGTWKWYEELRKADPKLYWEPKTQTQMLKDSQRLGEAFDE